MASSDPTAQAPRKSAKPAARSNRDSLRWTAGLLLFFFLLARYRSLCFFLYNFVYYYLSIFIKFVFW